MKLPKGFSLSGIHCGIKKRKLDLGLIAVNSFALCEGFFTRNANPSYSVVVSKKNITNPIKAILVNSGNANCFTHSQGLTSTRKMCAQLASRLGVKEKNVLVASTGIIGKKLPIAKILKSFGKLQVNLGFSWKPFAQSILTTDTRIKVSYRSIVVNGKAVRLMGFAKGAGMIHPDLATMLVFILTDAAITRSRLRSIAKNALNKSFNAISIDGCMSTNDSVYIISSKQSASIESTWAVDRFSKALEEVCGDLSKEIVRDGEGVTKFITLRVYQAKSPLEAKRSATAIASSLLFKAAMYGSGFNWGRIVAALGQIGISVDEKKFRVTKNKLHNKEVHLGVYLGRGKSSYTMYTSDLTPDYVKINAGYS